MEGKCLFSIPKVGITGRHIIILEFAKVGVMVIAFPIMLVPSVVITSLSNPLIRLELRLSLFFGVVVSIEPNALGLIIAPAELFGLEYVSHGIHTFTNDSRLGYCTRSPIQLVRLFGISNQLSCLQMPRRPHGVHPRRREADARASFGPISAHKYLETTERARNDNTAQRQLPRSAGCGLLQRRARVERVLHSRRAPQRAHAIHRRKRQEPVKPTARARPRTRAHVASAYDEPSLLGGHPPKTRIGRRCTNSKQ